MLKETFPTQRKGLNESSDAHHPGPKVAAKDAVEEVEQNGTDVVVLELDGDGPEDVVAALEGEMLP